MTSRLDTAASHPARPLPVAIHNQVLFTLVIVGGVTALASGFVSLAPNRLISGSAVPLWAAAGSPPAIGVAVLGAILLGACFAVPTRAVCCAALVSAGALLILVLAVAGQSSSRLMAGAKPAARVSLGPAFWMLAGCAILAMTDALQRLAAGIGARVLVVMSIASGIGLLAAGGAFDALSIVREYLSHRQVFAQALLRHMMLVGISVGGAVAIGFPLGVTVVRRPRLQGPVFAILNLLQTIPSIALFGLLIVPLSALVTAVPGLAALGIGGIGVTPAIIALVLYALLPAVRNTSAGLAGVDRAAIDAGRGMGLNRRQIFWQLELPLALPVLLAGLRIVTVQAVGLAVVAALIGAGGLGTFVFDGLGQYAVDLVLLGALPAILLALAADFVIQIVSALLRQRDAP